MALEYSKANPPSSGQMERDLVTLDFGIRVLKLEQRGAKRSKALVDACEELDWLTRKGEYLDIRTLRVKFSEFRKLAADRGFIPYFSLDRATGQLVQTEFVLAHLEAEHRGRPKKG